MEEEHKTVRKLADEMGVSKTVAQNLRSGEQTDIKFSNFINMAESFGYHAVLERDNKRIALS